MWQEFNDKIAARIMAYLDTEKQCDANTVAKVRYAILVLLDESEKFILLSLLFGFFYDVRKFYLAFMALGSLRIFMGGSHRQTKMGCLLSSLFNFGMILFLSDFFTLSVPLAGGLAVLLALEIIFRTPLASPQQLHYNDKQRIKMKRRAFIALTVWICICRFLPVDIRNIVFWAWAFQAGEVLLVLACRSRREAKV